MSAMPQPVNKLFLAFDAEPPELIDPMDEFPAERADPEMQSISAAVERSKAEHHAGAAAEARLRSETLARDMAETRARAESAAAAAAAGRMRADEQVRAMAEERARAEQAAYEAALSRARTEAEILKEA